MDIQKIINDVIAKLKADDNLLENFKTNPTKVLEKLAAAGMAIPEPMSPNPSLRFYFVKDPDGYSIQLVETLGG